jgi:hypothetical protein
MVLWREMTMALSDFLEGTVGAGSGTGSSVEVASNRRAPDELADVREQIKALKAREDELRERVLAGEDVGDRFRAVVSRSAQERVDVALLRKELSKSQLEHFLKKTETVVVRLEQLSAPDEEILA